MSTSSPSNKFHGIGWLFANPTDLGAARPYGGTELGLVRDKKFVPGFVAPEVAGEEFAGATVEVVYGGQRAAIFAVLREWDNDAIATVFPYTDTDGNGDVFIEHNPADDDYDRAGKFLSSRSKTIMFAPRAEDAHPWIILDDAIPLVQQAAEIQMGLPKEFGLAVAFLGIPRTADGGRLYTGGKKAGMALLGGGGPVA